VRVCNTRTHVHTHAHTRTPQAFDPSYRHELKKYKLLTQDIRKARERGGGKGRREGGRKGGKEGREGGREIATRERGTQMEAMGCGRWGGEGAMGVQGAG
jgi:hypothetical protein